MLELPQWSIYSHFYKITKAIIYLITIRNFNSATKRSGSTLKRGSDCYKHQIFNKILNFHADILAFSDSNNNKEAVHIVTESIDGVDQLLLVENLSGVTEEEIEIKKKTRTKSCHS